MAKPRNLTPFHELESTYAHRGLKFTSLEATWLWPTSSLYGGVDGMIFSAHFRGTEASLDLGYSFPDKHYWDAYYASYQKWLENLAVIDASFEAGAIDEMEHTLNYQMIHDLEPKLVLPKDNVTAKVDVVVMRSRFPIPNQSVKPPWRHVDEVETAGLFEKLLSKAEIFTQESSALA